MILILRILQYWADKNYNLERNRFRKLRKGFRKFEKI